MSQHTVEKRLAAIEHQVAELKSVVDASLRPKDWRQTVGMFLGDEVMGRVLDEALRLREEDRKKIRRKRPRIQRTAK